MGGDPLAFSVMYGRAELGDIVGKAGHDDVPIKPGETYVFTIYPAQVPAWEYSVHKGNHPQASRIRAKLEALSFGDGTGYFGDSPYPPVSPRQSILDERTRPPNKSQPQGHASPRSRAAQTPLKSIINTPVSFLPANFLPYESKAFTPTATTPYPRMVVSLSIVSV